VPTGLRPRRSPSPPAPHGAHAGSRRCSFPPVLLPAGAVSRSRPFFFRLSVACRPSQPPLLPSHTLRAGVPPCKHPPRWHPFPLAPTRVCALPRWCRSLLAPRAGSAPPFWRLSLVVRLSGVALPWVCPSLVAPLPGGPHRRPSSVAPPPAGIPRRWRLSLVVPLPCAADPLWRPSLVAPFPGGPHWRPSPLAPPLLASLHTGVFRCCAPPSCCRSMDVPLPGGAPPCWSPSRLAPLPDGSSPCFCAFRLAYIQAVAPAQARTHLAAGVGSTAALVEIFVCTICKKRCPSLFCRPVSSCGIVASKMPPIWSCILLRRQTQADLFLSLSLSGPIR